MFALRLGFKPVAPVIILWETDHHQLTAEDNPTDPFKVREDLLLCVVHSQGVSFRQAVQAQKCCMSPVYTKALEKMQMYTCTISFKEHTCNQTQWWVLVSALRGIENCHSFTILKLYISIFTHIQTRY